MAHLIIPFLFVVSYLITTDVLGYPVGNLYQTLGVRKDATLADIKSRYKKLARELHPDSTEIKDREKVRKQFIEVTEAYEVLVDPHKRKSYDDQGAQGEYEDHQEARSYLRSNLFTKNFDGVELDQNALDLVWKNKHVDQQNSYAVFFWSSNYPDCVDAAVAWRQLATRLKGTTIRVTALRCDFNNQICRRLNLNDVPAAFFFSEGHKTKFVGKFELQQLMEYAVPLIRLPKGTIQNVTLAAFNRCPVVPLTLDMYRTTVLRQIVLEFVTFEYSECYDCGTELRLMLEMMQRINPLQALRVDCSDLDSEVCEEYGKRDINRAWSIGRVTLEVAATARKNIVKVKDPPVVRTNWFSGKHSSAAYVQFVLKYRNLKNSEALTDLTEVKKGESGYAVAFYREDLADLTVHFEMFSRAVTTTVIQYEKNPSLTVQVRRVDCQATPDLCNDVAGHELPVLAVYPFGLKAKSRPPSIAKMVDATQLMEFVKKDVVPLRLYVLNQENFHQKLIRTGPKAKPWFVLFNAGNWCPPCNQVRPVWKQLARDAMQSTDPGVKKIRIAEIDCDTHKVTCKEMKIDNYPSFVFYQGEVEKSYEGDRDAKSLLDFAANAVDNPVETPSAQQVMQIYQRSQSKPYALLLNAGDWCPPCMEIVAPWKQLAKLLPPNEWLGIGSVNCDQNRWLCQQFEVDGFPTVMILHAPGERKAVMPPTQQKSVELLLNWFRKYYPNL